MHVDESEAHRRNNIRNAFAAFCVCLKANIVASFLFLSYHPSFQKLHTVTYEYLVGIPYDDGASGQQNFVLLAH